VPACFLTVDSDQNYRTVFAARPTRIIMTFIYLSLDLRETKINTSPAGPDLFITLREASHAACICLSNVLPIFYRYLRDFNMIRIGSDFPLYDLQTVRLVLLPSH
jgi:hypothetical protein